MRRLLLTTVAVLVASIVTADSQRPSDDRALVKAAANATALHRVTAEPFLMHDLTALLCQPAAALKVHTPHTDYYCHVFVNDVGLKAMSSGKEKFPVGTIIVKQKFPDPKHVVAELYTLMRKMPAGYDDSHGDWEYSVINGKADKVISRGRTDSCIECHQAYPKSDYVTRLYMNPAK